MEQEQFLLQAINMTNRELSDQHINALTRANLLTVKLALATEENSNLNKELTQVTEESTKLKQEVAELKALLDEQTKPEGQEVSHD